MGEYKKDFDGWNEEKKKINEKEISFYYHEREILWSSIGVNIGSEMDGKNSNFERPVLILKKINRNQFLGIPLTSKEKDGDFYVRIQYSDDKGVGTANMSQVRVFSSKRLLRKIGLVKKKDFLLLRETFFSFLSKDER